MDYKSKALKYKLKYFKLLDKMSTIKQTGGGEIFVIISGDYGGWFPAREEQINALKAFLRQKIHMFKYNIPNSNNEFYMIRSRSEGQSNRWVEIQDRNGSKKWRKIEILERSNPPSD